MDERLLPCPFCGAGTYEIRENGKMWDGEKYSPPGSVSVRHWCVTLTGQPSRMIERIGRDEASAIEIWNMRARENDMDENELYQRFDRLISQVARLALLVRVLLWLGIAVAICWAMVRY